jgi:hypothetical protein
MKITSLLLGLFAAIALCSCSKSSDKKEIAHLVAGGGSKYTEEKTMTLLENGYRFVGSYSVGNEARIFFEREGEHPIDESRVPALQSIIDGLKKEGAQAWRYAFKERFSDAKRCGFCRSAAAEDYSRPIEHGAVLPSRCECGAASDLTVVAASAAWKRPNED